MEKIKLPANGLVNVLTLAAFVASLLGRDTASLTIFFFLFHFGLLMSFEGLTYEEFALLDLKSQLIAISNKWYRYIFTSNSNLTLRDLFSIEK